MSHLLVSSNVLLLLSILCNLWPDRKLEARSHFSCWHRSSLSIDSSKVSQCSACTTAKVKIWTLMRCFKPTVAPPFSSEFQVWERPHGRGGQFCTCSQLLTSKTNIWTGWSCKRSPFVSCKLGEKNTVLGSCNQNKILNQQLKCHIPFWPISLLQQHTFRLVSLSSHTIYSCYPRSRASNNRTGKQRQVSRFSWEAAEPFEHRILKILMVLRIHTS